MVLTRVGQLLMTSKVGNGSVLVFNKILTHLTIFYILKIKLIKQCRFMFSDILFFKGIHVVLNLINLLLQTLNHFSLLF
jgi:hypothetical protein